MCGPVGDTLQELSPEFFEQFDCREIWRHKYTRPQLDQRRRVSACGGMCFVDSSIVHKRCLRAGFVRAADEYQAEKIRATPSGLHSTTWMQYTSLEMIEY